ncbi:MAG: hypothetical protein WCS70_15140 [Verrucomicrobiota bacterium]
MARTTSRQLSKRRCGFVTIEVLLALGLAAVGFASFSTFFNSVRQEHRYQQNRGAAVFLLQSKLEELRQSWPAVTGVAYPALPERISIGRGQFAWQLTAAHPPEPGKFFPYQVAIVWTERGREHRVSATTGRVAP